MYGLDHGEMIGWWDDWMVDGWWLMIDESYDRNHRHHPHFRFLTENFWGFTLLVNACWIWSNLIHWKSQRQNLFPRIEVEGEVGIKSSIHQQKGHWCIGGYLPRVFYLASHTSWQNRNRGEIGSRDLYGAGGWQGAAMCAWFLKFVLGTQKDGCEKVGVWSITLPETNSSPLKMDGWNTIGFFWAPALFSGAFAVHFAGEGIIPKFISQQNVTFHISLTKCP